MKRNALNLVGTKQKIMVMKLYNPFYTDIKIYLHFLLFVTTKLKS